MSVALMLEVFRTAVRRVGHLDQGRQVEAKIRALAADLLTIASRRDSSDMPYTSIVRIDRPRDGLGNGALWGFGIGAGFGLAGVIDEEVRECENVGFFAVAILNPRPMSCSHSSQVASAR